MFAADESFINEYDDVVVYTVVYETKNVSKRKKQTNKLCARILYS